MGTVSTYIVSQVNSFCQHNQATSCRTIVSFPVSQTQSIKTISVSYLGYRTVKMQPFITMDKIIENP